MPDRPAGAFLVHVLTASGAALAFLALRAAIDSRWPAMFMWLGLALAVDAADGPLARYFRVRETLPRWSGETLDLVVDFVTYVFVPAYAIAASGLLLPPFDIAAGIVIVVTGALYFGDSHMKTPDNYFRGFPALWNCAAFYLLLLRPTAWLAAALVAALAVLTFVPFRFIHPMRVRRLRQLNLALLAVWAGLALWAVWRDMAPASWVTAGLCAIGLYVLAAGFLRRPDEAPPSTK
ncbi:MAG TPA: phosphatidylcholine synthase [Xanthobacteraceae bacterium]|jgi:phosphatidylcholine synthase|nr:phosphatidylcholine synthase [Xanthobacteraceae bacterium]